MVPRPQRPSRWLLLWLAATAACPGGGAGAEGGPRSGADPGARAAIEKVVADYVALYTGPTLERWKSLFDPRLTVASPAPDGSVRVRDLEEFYRAQKQAFDAGKQIGERLENLRIEPGRRIGRVTADFVFVADGRESRGKLGLHLVQREEGWRIIAVVFSYDDPEERGALGVRRER